MLSVTAGDLACHRQLQAKGAIKNFIRMRYLVKIMIAEIPQKEKS